MIHSRNELLTIKTLSRNVNKKNENGEWVFKRQARLMAMVLYNRKPKSRCRVIRQFISPIKMKFQMELMPFDKKRASCLLLLELETGKKCRLANRIGFGLRGVSSASFYRNSGDSFRIYFRGKVLWS